MADEQLRVLEDILQRFDKNGDGTISLEEITAEFATLEDPATAAVLKDLMLANWDSDRDGRLSPAEIRAMAETWASFPGDQSKPRS